MGLPANFRARRTSANLAMEPGKPVEIFNATGAGCIRHLWFVFGEKNIDDLSIEITVDGAAEAQVKMPFRSFFGALLGFGDYPIESAGLANFPNLTVTNDPLIPKEASPGWNLYLPIPFSKGCRILLSAGSAKNGGGMIDWQEYRGEAALTPFRFHAQRNLAQPAIATEPFPITEADALQPTQRFGWPPLPWIGARFKWDVRERDGSKVLAKTLAEHDGIDAIWFAGDAATSTMVEQASVGNLKQTWTTRGLYYDLSDRQKFEGDYLLRRATQMKNVWIPYGA
jgi:hypothetical protein